MMTDSQGWIKGMKVLNAAQEVVEGGLNKVKLAAVTAAFKLSSSEKSDVYMLYDFVSAEALSLCDELSQWSTDSRRALVEGAAKLQGRSSIGTDTARSMVGLMLNIRRNGAFCRKLQSQQSLFEQASDHQCSSCRSLVQKSIILRALPTLGDQISWRWCQLARVFDADVSTSLAALLLFLESVLASGGAEHRWALYNAACRADAKAVVKAFATVDTAEYCSEVKALLSSMLPHAPFMAAVQAYTPNEEFNVHYHHLEELLEARVETLRREHQQQQQQQQQQEQQQQQQLQTLTAEVTTLRGQLQQQQQQQYEQQLLMQAALAQAPTWCLSDATTAALSNISDDVSGTYLAPQNTMATASAITAGSTDDTPQLATQFDSSGSSNQALLLASEQHAAQQQPAAKRARTAHADTDITSVGNTAAELTADSNVCVRSSSSRTANTTAVSHSVASTLHTDSVTASSATLNMTEQSQAVVAAMVSSAATASTFTNDTATASTQYHNGSDMDTQLTSNLMLLMSNTHAGHFTEQFRLQQAEALVTAWNTARRDDVCVKLEMLKFWCAHGHIDGQFRRAQAEQAWAYYVQQQQQQQL
jgi:hypothetical protein